MSRTLFGPVLIQALFGLIYHSHVGLMFYASGMECLLGWAHGPALNWVFDPEIGLCALVLLVFSVLG